MANTISTNTFGEKYLKAQLENALRLNTVATAICDVDRSGLKYIQSPYVSTPTVVVQALAGTYTPADFTTTDDTLTVTDEFIVSNSIRDFEQTLSNFDVMAKMTDEMATRVKESIDKYVINNLCEDGTGLYTTPVGGFTTAANVNTIFGALVAKTMGYAEAMNNQFIVLENTDMAGVISAGATNGFMMADKVLTNGKVGQWMGVDIYVVPSGTFVDATIGTKPVTNSGHRVFGVKNVATFAFPEDLKYEVKSVTGKTGKEIAVFGYIGFKLWTPKAALVVDITLA